MELFTNNNNNTKRLQYYAESALISLATSITSWKPFSWNSLIRLFVFHHELIPFFSRHYFEYFFPNIEKTRTNSGALKADNDDLAEQDVTEGSVFIRHCWIHVRMIYKQWLCCSKCGAKVIPPLGIQAMRKKASLPQRQHAVSLFVNQMSC